LAAAGEFSHDVSVWIGGIDGCKSGWVLALRRLGDSAVTLRLLPKIADALGLSENPAILAVDMPIGLPDIAAPGGRDCERAARKLLPGKSSSVFSIPCRATLEATTYKQALTLNRHGNGVGLSQQAFHLIPKLRELDKVITPELQPRLVEAHPELAFALMNDGRPVLSRKRKPDGRIERLDLLRRAGLEIHESMLTDRPRGVGIDDALDAIALTRTAERLSRGEAVRLPGQVQCDARGLRMEICY
jgi:predicted RNase H-like nuclease